MHLIGLLFLLLLGPCAIGVSDSISTPTTDMVESALKNAATAEESYATSHRGKYTLSVDDLVNEGWNLTPGVTLTVASVDGFDYCLEAVHDDTPDAVHHYSSRVGMPEPGPCP